MSPHVENITRYHRPETDGSYLKTQLGDGDGPLPDDSCLKTQIAALHKVIPGTKHKTDDKESPELTYAHSIALNNPDLEEVGDDLGPPCEDLFPESEVSNP